MYHSSLLSPIHSLLVGPCWIWAFKNCNAHHKTSWSTWHFFYMPQKPDMNSDVRGFFRKTNYIFTETRLKTKKRNNSDDPPRAAHSVYTFFFHLPQTFPILVMYRPEVIFRLWSFRDKDFLDKEAWRGRGKGKLGSRTSHMRQNWDRRFFSPCFVSPDINKGTRRSHSN